MTMAITASVQGGADALLPGAIRNATKAPSASDICSDHWKSQSEPMTRLLESAGSAKMPTQTMIAIFTLVLPRTIGNRPMAMCVMTSMGDRNAMAAIDPSTIPGSAPTSRRVVRVDAR